MKRSKFSDERNGVVREQRTVARIAKVCRQHEISSATLYAEKSKCGGLGVFAARRLNAVEEGSSKLKRLLGDVMLDNAALKDLLAPEL